jgi:hypothetical protein
MPTQTKQPFLDPRDKSSPDEAWLKRLPTNLDNIPEVKTIPCKVLSWLNSGVGREQAEKAEWKACQTVCLELSEACWESKRHKVSN